MYSFVTTPLINQEFKKSKYFKKKLGMSITSKKEEIVKFEINPKDKFLKDYYDKFGVVLQNEGNIGKIEFYSDFYVSESVIGVYREDSEFIFDFKKSDLEQGVDAYLGSIIKEIEETPIVEESVKEEHLEEGEGDANKLFNSPGAVNYEDIKKYLQKRNIRK